MVDRGVNGRHTPHIHNPCSDHLLWVICDVWTKAVYCPTEVVIGTPDEVPLLHIWFDGIIDHRQKPVEEAIAVVTEGIILYIFPGTCES